MLRKIKVWLYKNPLTPDPNDHIGVVDSPGTATISDVIAELRKDGMELQPETALDVVTRYNRKVTDLLLTGYRVDTGLTYMRPMAKGAIVGKVWDPAKNHIYVSITQSAELRKAIAELTVEILGIHADAAVFYSVTDTSTGKTDGTVTRGFGVDLTGSLIKVDGDKPGNGIYLRQLSTQIDNPVEATYITINDPSRVMFILPPWLPSETYELRIVTQYSGGGKYLKESRTITLDIPLTVV
jgi:hypothetical protein